MALNPKHHAAAQAYMADPARIGWRAYQSVFPKATKAAAQTAWSRLFKKVEFQALIAELNAKAADASVMSAREVLAELSKLGRSNMKRFLVDGDNTAEVIASLQDLADEDAAAIQEIVVDTYMEGSGEAARPVKRVRLKLHSKAAALSELRAHYEPSRHEHTGKDGGPIETKDAGEMSELELVRRMAFLLSRAAKKEG